MASIDKKIAIRNYESDGAKKGSKSERGWNSRRRQARANKRGARREALKVALTD